MCKPIEHHNVLIDAASAYWTEHYGVLYKSRHVYSTTRSHSPTRIVVWDNTCRPNPDKGKGLGDRLHGGNVLTRHSAPGTATAAYTDPHGKPTDDPVTILLSTESTVICADTRFNTGQAGSGQVYATDGLGDGDTATLVYPDGSTIEVVLRFPPHNNGHGYAVLVKGRNAQ